MRITIQTAPRIGDRPNGRRRRRKKKNPEPLTALRVEWLEWLVTEYGAEPVGDWAEPPVTFAQWRALRELAAHEAA